MKYKYLILTGLLIAGGSVYAAQDEFLEDVIKKANAADDIGKGMLCGESQHDGQYP